MAQNFNSEMGGDSHLNRYDSMVSSESEVDIGEFDMDDAMESKLHGLHARKKTRRELLQELLEELEGAEVNKFLGFASFCFASASVVFGVCSPLEHIEGCYRVFAALAALFLVNQSFFIVKTMREQDIQPFPDHRNRVIPDWFFLQGRYPSVDAKGKIIKDSNGNVEKGSFVHSFHEVVMWLSFPFALGAFGYGLYFMDAHVATQMFLAQGVLYMWSSSLNYASMLRDKFEAKVWEGELEGRHIGSKRVELAAKNVMNVLKYHQRQFQIIFFAIACASIVMVSLALAHWLSKKDKDKGIGLFTAAMFMCMSSSWNLARVLNNNRKLLELSVIGSFVIAIVLSVVGLVVVQLGPKHKLVLALSLVILVDSTFNFAKVQHRLKTVNKLTKVVKRKFHMEVDGEEDDHGGGSARKVNAGKPSGGKKGGSKKGGH